jgi:NAD(P)H-dependent flavin oxidoreductase YrpB (nitropropane dioxygenase family)
MIQELKSLLPPTPPTSPDSTRPPTYPFAIDLALPKVGAGARATNHDYTHGQLDQLIDVIIEEKARLFVSAVGVPPKSVIDRLHKRGVLVMNMIGHPKHAEKAYEAGVDIVCAQGGEGGGHTGEISMGILVPACVDVARRYRPAALGGREGMVVAAGGIYDGRGLASALMLGAVGVWVGTRFVASEEAGCSKLHKQAVVEAGWGDTVRTLVVSGRPLRVRRNEYIEGWEKREKEVKELTERGVVPMMKDLEEDREVDFPYLMGVVSAVVGEVKPAGEIVEEMVREAVECLRVGGGYLGSGRESKL